MQPSSNVRAFLKQYQEDEAAGSLRTLEEYQELFPGSDDSIERAYEALLDEATLVREEDLATHEFFMTTLSTEEAKGAFVGRVLGDYRIDKQLGQGGQGLVFLATDQRLNRPVALKVLSGLAGHSRRTLMRFRREAELASGLNDPGICTVYETGTIDNIPFIAMEFVDGQSLSSILKEERATLTEGDSTKKSSFSTLTEGSLTHKGRGRTDRCVQIVRDIARSLQTAHENNLVHRDIKPGNIMVTKSGRPVILDFGIAHDEDDETLGLTRTGDVIGTPAYMAPEQVRGDHREVDCRTDVYALGVTLFECITLSRPFHASSREALYQEIIEGRRPAVSSMVPEAGRDIDVIVQKAMDLEKGRRYRSAAAFADDLDRYLAHQPIKARPAGVGLRLYKWAERNPAVAVLLTCVFVLLSAGLIVTTSLWQESESDKLRAERESRRADKKAEEAEDRLRDFQMVSDGRRFMLLQDEVQFLYPPGPGKIEAIDKWLAEVDLLMSREPLYQAKLDEVREDSYPLEMDVIRKDETYREVLVLNEIMRRRDVIEKTLEDSTLEESQRTDLKNLDQSLAGLTARFEKALLKHFKHSFDDKDKDWLHYNLLHILKSIRVFNKRDTPGYPVADVLEIRRRSELIAQKSLVEGRELWDDAIARIASKTESPKYNGLIIEPQMGLLPLGPDPKTGLWEFVHVLTGSTPTRDANGKLVCAHDAGVVFVLLPGGRCKVGAVPPAHPNQIGPHIDPAAAEAPFDIREVDLDPFFIAKHEMTLSQWEQVANETIRWQIGQRGMTEKKWRYAGRIPISDVSWKLVRKFCRHIGFDLPTEVQWEYACRAGTDTIWWTGSKPSSLMGLVNLSDDGSRNVGLLSWNDGYESVAPVDSMAVNGFGLHHMIGNVWEMTSDGPKVEDGVLHPGDGFHSLTPPDDIVIRGGGYRNVPQRATSSNRATLTPESSASSIGFRASRCLKGRWERR